MDITKREKENNENTKIGKKKIKTKRRDRRRRKKKKYIIIIFIIILLISLLTTGLILYNKNEERKLQLQENLKNEIKSHYNKYVMVNKETDLFVLENDKYIKSGKINEGEEITLVDTEITYQDEYLKIENFDNQYYIYYKNISKIEELTKTTTRYQKYIPFNSNVVTKDTTNFYDENKKLIYTFKKSFNLPIIVKYDNFYGVEYNNKLLYIDKEDIKEIIDNNNTDNLNTKGIAILNYHFFEDSDKKGDVCNQIICISTKNLKKHLDYIKNNNIFTPTLKELEMYIDGYIQLPKSVVLTIDDGWRAKIGSQVISDYGLNATIFLMSKHYDPRNYQNEYIEVHSHGHDIHNGGMCPGGQGGEIKCMEKTKLLKDLNASREKLNNTTYFCYPFYEYNDYAISVLKEAGFTMAFAGYNEGGKTKAIPGINKFKLPRYVIYNYTSANEIANYIN